MACSQTACWQLWAQNSSKPGKQGGILAEEACLQAESDELSAAKPLALPEAHDNKKAEDTRRTNVKLVKQMPGCKACDDKSDVPAQASGNSRRVINLVLRVMATRSGCIRPHFLCPATPCTVPGLPRLGIGQEK